MRLFYTFNKTDYPISSVIKLPFGVKKIKIKGSTGGLSIRELGYIAASSINVIQTIEFPIINGHSPNKFTISYWDEKATAVEIFIEELGGIPDPNYFSDTPTVIPEIISDEPTEQEEKKDAI